MSIAARIREVRDHRGLSQADLAAAVGVTRGACGHWEQGKTAPSVENLARIAGVLGVRFEWLATGRGVRDYDPLGVDEKLPRQYAPAPMGLDREEQEVLAVLSRLPTGCRARLVEFLRSIPVCTSP
jgi:transcriptional regulator with XRE-family HTH domain